MPSSLQTLKVFWGSWWQGWLSLNDMKASTPASWRNWLGFTPQVMRAWRETKELISWWVALQPQRTIVGMRLTSRVKSGWGMSLRPQIARLSKGSRSLGFKEEMAARALREVQLVTGSISSVVNHQFSDASMDVEEIDRAVMDVYGLQWRLSVKQINKWFLRRYETSCKSGCPWHTDLPYRCIFSF